MTGESMEETIKCRCGRSWLIIWPKLRDNDLVARWAMQLRAAEKARGQAVADRQRFFEANERLQVRVAELQSGLREAVDTANERAAHVLLLTNANEKLETRVKELEKELNETQADRYSSGRELRMAQADLQQARVQRDSWQRAAENWQTAAGGAGEKIAELQRRIDELEQDNEGLAQAEHAADRAREDLLQMKTERDNLKVIQRHLDQYHSFGKCVPRADVDALRVEKESLDKDNRLLRRVVAPIASESEPHEPEGCCF